MNRILLSIFALMLSVAPAGAFAAPQSADTTRQYKLFPSQRDKRDARLLRTIDSLNAIIAALRTELAERDSLDAAIAAEENAARAVPDAIAQETAA